MHWFQCVLWGGPGLTPEASARSPGDKHWAPHGQQGGMAFTCVTCWPTGDDDVWRKGSLVEQFENQLWANSKELCKPADIGKGGRASKWRMGWFLTPSSQTWNEPHWWTHISNNHACPPEGTRTVKHAGWDFLLEPSALHYGGQKKCGNSGPLSKRKSHDSHPTVSTWAHVQQNSSSAFRAAVSQHPRACDRNI